MPEDMPNRMPEDMSDRMPEDLRVTKCVNVMVGITRSKVIIIFFIIFFIIFLIIFHHFFFQWCKNFPRNGKLQFSSSFFHFLLDYSELTPPDPKSCV